MTGPTFVGGLDIEVSICPYAQEEARRRHDRKGKLACQSEKQEYLSARRHS